MGSSFVEYKGFGFWTRDSYLEEWLTILSKELEKLQAREDWQTSLAKHWRIQAEIDGGCMWTGLDDFLTDEAKHNMVLSLAKRSLPLTGPVSRRTGELFVDLLEGKLRTTSSSPIDYL